MVMAKNDNNLAAIIIFVYNRPQKTRKCIHSLSQNNLIQKSNVYIFCDGVPSNADEKQRKSIREVRNIVEETNLGNTKHVKESEINKGLSTSILDGVSEVLMQEEKAIILEDDIITSKHFLSYMNNALNIYKSVDKVMGVTAYCNPTEYSLPETYFLPLGSSWGWGTWKSVWNSFNPNPDKLYHTLKEERLFEVFNSISIGAPPYQQILENHIAGKVESWAVLFQAYVVANRGLFLWPNESLVKNIGFDKEATHTKNKPERYPVFTHRKIAVEKKKPEVKKEVLRAFQGEDTNGRNYSHYLSRIKKYILEKIS